MKQIKKLTMEDYPEISALSQFSFQYELSPESYEKKRKEAERHDKWGYIVDGKLAGKAHIIPLQVLINEKRLPMGGISSVCTWPEYRRQGIAKKLMYRTLEEMNKQNQTISYLHPFHVGFYRKLGWELAFEKHNLTIPIEKLKGYGKQSEGYMVRESNDLKTMQIIYHSYAVQFNGMLDRDELWWQQRVLTNSSAQIAIAYNDKDIAEGYVVYEVKENILTVQDYAYVNQNGRNLVFNFITNHDSMANSVKITVPKNDLLLYTLDDPMIENEIEPYFMIRIVNVQAFLEAYPFETENFELTIQVEDSFFEDNNGCYHIENIDGKTNVQKITEQKTAMIHCSIQQLASVMIGYQCPFYLHQCQLIAGELSAVQKLASIIPTKQTFFTDFF